MKLSSDTRTLVVTDTGPLIALAKSGYLHLFPALFSCVIIPDIDPLCAEILRLAGEEV